MFIGTKYISYFVLIALNQCPAQILSPIISCHQWVVIKTLLGFLFCYSSIINIRNIMRVFRKQCGHISKLHELLLKMSL